jgi:hypothetical protein
MFKPFLLSLALSGLGMAGMGAQSAEQTPSAVSTWRWNVNAILEAQRLPHGVGAMPAQTFAQHYRRYSALGLPEASTR